MTLFHAQNNCVHESLHVVPGGARGIHAEAVSGRSNDAKEAISGGGDNPCMILLQMHCFQCVLFFFIIYLQTYKVLTGCLKNRMWSVPLIFQGVSLLHN